MTIDLELLSEAIPQQVGILSSDGTYLYVNESFLRCYGTTQSDVIGRTVLDVINQDLASEYLPFIERALNGESGEIRHTFPNPGEGRAWKTSFVPRPEGGCLIVSDNPGKIDSKPHRVPRVDERLRTFVDFAPIGMVFSHSDGRIFEANRAFLDLVGYTREELVNGEIHWNSLTPKEFLHLDYAAIAEAKESGFSRTYEKMYLTKQGFRVPILVGFILVGPTRDEAVAFVVDLTAQKKAEDEAHRLNTELEQRVVMRTMELELANRELEAFCYSVSHDLRAPLRSIDGFAYALTQDYGDKLGSDATDFISRIRASAKRMDELISALLALSRLTRLELDQESVDLSEMGETVAAELRHQNPERNLQINIQPNLTVKADRRMLGVVLDNLIGNAVKFTAKNSDPRVAFGKDPTSGAFYVRDNGVGFDMKESSKLFQPFERLHSPREFSGNGIGLATVQRIVRKHGGKIWAHSEVDKGSTFFFTL